MIEKNNMDQRWAAQLVVFWRKVIQNAHLPLKVPKNTDFYHYTLTFIRLGWDAVPS